MLLMLLAIAGLLLVIISAVVRCRRREGVRTELLIRDLAQARIRSQLNWTLRAMLHAAAESTPPPDDDPIGHEITRR